jgi:hypothetical protein
MKNLLTGVFTLLAMSFGFAQSNIDVTSQIGNLNVATVDQTGLLNMNFLTQNGNGIRQILIRLELSTLIQLKV